MAEMYKSKNTMSSIYFCDYFDKFYKNTDEEVYGADIPLVGLPYNEEL